MSKIIRTNKYLDLAREFGEGCTCVTVIPIVVGALGTLPKGLERCWNSWKSGEKLKPFRLQHCSDRPYLCEKFYIVCDS